MLGKDPLELQAFKQHRKHEFMNTQLDKLRQMLQRLKRGHSVDDMKRKE